MGKKSKYYVVWKGNKEGIFTTWDECKQQVLGVPGSKYKSFTTLIEAEHAYKNGWKSETTQKKNTVQNNQQTFNLLIIPPI